MLDFESPGRQFSTKLRILSNCANGVTDVNSRVGPDIRLDYPAGFKILPDYPAGYGYPAYPAGSSRHRIPGIRQEIPDPAQP